MGDVQVMLWDNFRVLVLGVAPVLCFFSCRSGDVPAVPPPLRLANELNVQAENPKRGEPISLHGRDDFFCAERHDAPMACIGLFNLSLKPKKAEPHDRELDAGVRTVQSDEPWAIDGVELGGLDARLGNRCFIDGGGAVLCSPKKPGERRDLVPIEVGGIKDAKGIAIGASQCAIDGHGDVHCWSYSPCPSAEGRQEIPLTKIPGVSGARSIGAGSRFVCVSDSEGAVHCWGRVQDDDSCTGLSPERIGGIDNAVKVVVGYGFGCALLATNGVGCWGSNDDGVLAVPEAELLFSKNAVTIPGLRAVVDIESFRGGVVSLLANGEVWIWGDDLTASDPDQRPRRVPGISNATDIVAANEYGCALLGDHSLRCFGPRIDRNVKRNGQRPPFESKESWVDARVFEFWYDAPGRTGEP